MTMLASQITSLTVVYSIVYSGVNQRKHLAFVGPVNFPHKWPVTRKMFPFDDVIMTRINCRLAIFGAVDEPLASCVLVHFYDFSFKLKLVWKIRMV